MKDELNYINQLNIFNPDIFDKINNSLIDLGSNYFALAYARPEVGEVLSIIHKSENDAIVLIDYLIHDCQSGDLRSIVLIDLTHLVLAYRDIENRNYAKTFEIDTCYQTTQIDCLEFQHSDSWSEIILTKPGLCQLNYHVENGDTISKRYGFDDNRNIWPIDN